MCSVVLILHISWGLFCHMQEDLHHIDGKLLTLIKGIKQYLFDFLWMTDDVGQNKTQLLNGLMILPTLESYHDAYMYMCGGVVLP